MRASLSSFAFGRATFPSSTHKFGGAGRETQPRTEKLLQIYSLVGGWLLFLVDTFRPRYRIFDGSPMSLRPALQSLLFDVVRCSPTRFAIRSVAEQLHE